MKKLKSEDIVRVQWNQMSRNEKERIADKLKNQMHSKDIGQAHRYYYGNLYPKTRQAIRRYLSKG